MSFKENIYRLMALFIGGAIGVFMIKLVHVVLNTLFSDITIQQSVIVFFVILIYVIIRAGFYE